MTQSKKTQLKKNIKKTIKFFETHKWGQFLPHDPNTDTYCVIGAYGMVIANDPTQGYGSELSNAYQGKFGHSICVFNDRSHQKKSRVIAKLQKLHDLL